jgi:hypothetical protein
MHIAHIQKEFDPVERLKNQFIQNHQRKMARETNHMVDDDDTQAFISQQGTILAPKYLKAEKLLQDAGYCVSRLITLTTPKGRPIWKCTGLSVFGSSYHDEDAIKEILGSEYCINLCKNILQVVIN